MQRAERALATIDSAAPTRLEATRLHVNGLAHQVLRSLSESAARSPRNAVCADTLDVLVRAVLDAGAFDPSATVAEMRARGVGQEALSDHYVPAAAGRLGECWLSDDASFARVTVGSSRLQTMLGHLVQSNDLQQAWERTTPRVALIHMAGDTHSLGWKLLALKLRRQGVNVDALPGVTAREGADLVERTRADLVLVSASRLSSVAMIAEMADTLRARAHPVPPIVVGGLVLHALDAAVRFPDVVCLTNDLDVALACGPQHAVPARSRLG